MGTERRVTDVQVKVLRRHLQLGSSLSRAAMKSGMDRKSARKYREGQMPSEARKPRDWRTRKDPLEKVWPELEAMLKREPGLQAVTLLNWLQGAYPGEYGGEVRRTLERRVRRWRAEHGEDKEVYFAQVHEPGRLGASDFTHMDSLGVTIGGEAFGHLVYHFVLTHSNWEHVTVCFSESFASLSEGLQNALWALGGVPSRHRTDRMTMACHKDGNPEVFTARYRGLLDHYGIVAEATNPSSGHENGDCEQSHRRLKEWVDQALLLRGSRDFESRESYEAFLREVVERRNSRRRESIAAEMAQLSPLPGRRLESQERQQVRVRSGSTIQVSGNTYSVPARLIGEKVDVLVGAESIEVWYAEGLVQKMPRLRGSGKHDIDYRHVIGWLVRKPGAFARYAYRESMYPTTQFRRAFDSLVSQDGNRAERDYLQILHLASQVGESLVEGALAELLSGPEPLSVRRVRAKLGLETPKEAAEQVSVLSVDLSTYDDLLSTTDFLTEENSTDEAGVTGRFFTERFFKEEEANDGGEFGDAREGGACEGGACDRGSDAMSAGTAPADDADTARGGGEAGDSGVVGLHGLPSGVGASGSDSALSKPDRACVEGLEAAAGEELVGVGFEAFAGESGAAVAKPSERGFFGSSGERAGVRSAGEREDARVGGGSAGVGEVGATGAVRAVWPVRAGPVGGETRLQPEGDVEAAGPLGSGDSGRSWLRAAKPGGDGGAVHLPGGSLRARERDVDEQSAVLEVGADLQGSDDDGGSSGPFGASQRVGGDEHRKLPSGGGQAGEVESGVRGSELAGPWGRGGSATFAVATLRLPPLRHPVPTTSFAQTARGKIIVAKGER